MLCELYKHLEVDGEIDPDFVLSAIQDGHDWALEWKYPGIFGCPPIDAGIVDEVTGLLTMWSMIERAYEELSSSEQIRVTEEGRSSPSFPGFDGNNEAEHLSVAKFLVESMERYSEFQGRDLNSHAQSLPSQLRMKEKYDEIAMQGGLRSIDADKIIEIFVAARHTSTLLS